VTLRRWPKLTGGAAGMKKNHMLELARDEFRLLKVGPHKRGEGCGKGAKRPIIGNRSATHVMGNSGPPTYQKKGSARGICPHGSKTTGNEYGTWGLKKEKLAALRSLRADGQGASSLLRRRRRA